MPKHTPLPIELRRRVASLIAIGRGRNAIARQLNISNGAVTKIAKKFGLYFPGAERTHDATLAHKIDPSAGRLQREVELEEALDRCVAVRMASGALLPTRTERRLFYALYNLHRHHDRAIALQPEWERRNYQ